MFFFLSHLARVLAGWRSSLIVYSRRRGEVFFYLFILVGRVPVVPLDPVCVKIFAASLPGAMSIIPGLLS